MGYVRKLQSTPIHPFRPGTNNPWKDHIEADQAFARYLQQQEEQELQEERDLLLAYKINNGTADDEDKELAYFMHLESNKLIEEAVPILGPVKQANPGLWGLDPGLGMHRWIVLKRTNSIRRLILRIALMKQISWKRKDCKNGLMRKLRTRRRGSSGRGVMLGRVLPALRTMLGRTLCRNASTGTATSVSRMLSRPRYSRGRRFNAAKRH
jgi:hypothetical protein